MKLCLAALLALIFLHAPTLAQSVNVFSSDVQMCSGRPWIDVTCNGADPTGAIDSTTAIQNTITAAVSNDWPVLFPAGVYKVTSKITVEYGGQANNGPQLISNAATIDGRTIASGNVLQVQCTGGSTASPVTCNHFRIAGWLTVQGNGAGYVVTLGKADFSDVQAGVKIEHLVTTNAGAGGAVQANFLTDGDLWLSGATQGGSSSVGAVALEQVQTSRIGGWASALGASAPGLLIENGGSIANSFTGFAWDANDAVCISITSSTAARNAWLAPYLPCTTATNAPVGNGNTLINPTFAGTNNGPVSPGITVIGRGSTNHYSAPAAASLTLYGVDDGIILSAANATGVATQWAAASLPVTLPDPMQVGAGWTASFVSDANKAVVLTAPAGRFILSRGQQLSSLTVGAAGGSTSFEIATLQSDGATGFRLGYISQRAALLNGVQTQMPATWIHPGGPGYQLTQGDNGNVVSSGSTTAGLTVTLPATNAVQPGWMATLVPDAGKPLNVSGSPIISASGASVTRLTIPLLTTLQFDGSSFRVLLDTKKAEFSPLDWGCVGDGVTDDSACLGIAVAGASALGAKLYFDAYHLYYAPFGFTAATPPYLTGPYRYGIWVVNQGTGSGPQTCPWGLLGNGTHDMIHGTAVTGTIDGVCIDMTGNQMAQASTGAAIRLDPPNVTSYQSGWRIENNTILQAWDAIDINGAGVGAGCCGVGTTADGVAVLRNTIVDPRNAGISIGKNTVGASTVGITLTDNNIVCGKGGLPSNYGVVVYDGGAWYDGSQNGPEGCGTFIIPGVINGQNQWVQFNGDGVLGDQSKTYNLLVQPTGGNGTPGVGGIVYPLTIGGRGPWANTTSYTGYPTVLIDCRNAGTCTDINISGMHAYGGTSQNGPIIDVEGGMGGPINMSILGSFIGQGGTGTNSNAVGLKLHVGAGFNGRWLVNNNHFNASGFGATPDPVAVQLIIDNDSKNFHGNVMITGNDMSEQTTPFLYSPNPNTQDLVIIDHNLGPDTGNARALTAAGTVTLDNAWENYFVSGSTTINFINTPWGGRTIYFGAASGQLNLGTSGNICTPAMVGGSSAILKWMPGGACWTHFP